MAGDKCLGESCSGEEAAAIGICRAETLDDSLVVMRNEMCDVEICYLVDLDTGVDLADEEEAAEETHEPALRTGEWELTIVVIVAVLSLTCWRRRSISDTCSL